MVVGDDTQAGFIVQNAQQDHADDRQLTAQQESKLIHYCDQKLLEISRAYKNRAIQESDDAKSATALDALLAQISTLMDVLEKVPLGSVSIAVSYVLLILSSYLTDYLSVFEPSPFATFSLLARLDAYLSRLIIKEKLNMTERTRLSGILTRLRDVVFEKYPGEQYEASCSRTFQSTIELL